MPFTPFHLGPGALFKAIGGTRFSFMVFGGSQVLMDIEPGVRLIIGSGLLHGPTHTLYGAAAICLVAGLMGKPISEFVLRVAKIQHAPIGWTASFIGAIVGTFSHVALDAVMHADMSPWQPLLAGNPALGLFSLPTLHIICVVTGVLGVAGVYVRHRVKGRA